MPPDPNFTGPPDWLLGMIMVALGFLMVVFLFCVAEKERNQRKSDAVDIMARCMEQFKQETERERLIEKSPGGRKPWQN